MWNISVSDCPRFRKGDLVMINPNDPEIERLMGWGEKEPVRYMASRPSTPEEREEWRQRKQEELREMAARGEDTFDIAFDSGGESRLPPRSISVGLSIDEIFVVERARCRVELGWGNPTGGMARILSTKTGEHAYVRRDMLRLVQE